VLICCCWCNTWSALGLCAYPLCRVTLITVPLLQRVTFSKSRKSNQKGPAPGLALVPRVPSLRRRSVGPRRTDIHVLAALSRHPCRSAHSTPPAFSLHPSRDWCRLDYCVRRSRSTATATATATANTEPVAVRLADGGDFTYATRGQTERRPAILLREGGHAYTRNDRSHAPRGNAFQDALRPG
jgi:hypothetical protein